MLSTYTYSVPSGHTAVYLKPVTISPGRIEVHLDSPTGTIGHTFTNNDGLDIIDCGSASNFQFVDQVSAAMKPAADANGDSGIKVQGGSGTGVRTLEIDAGVNDQWMRITQSTITSATVKVTDSASDPFTTYDGYSRLGAGINHLKLVTNGTVADSFYDPVNKTGTGTQVDVGTLSGSLPGLSSTLSLTIDTGAGTYNKINLGGSDDASILGALIHTGAGHDEVNLLSDFDGDEVVTAAIDFDPGGNTTPAGNTLFVSAGATATLQAYAGTSAHTMVLDSATVHGGETTDTSGPAVEATLVVDNPATIGSIEDTGDLFGNGGGGTVIVAAASTITTFDVTLNCTAVVESPCTIDTFTTAGPVEFTGGAAGTIVGTFGTSTGSVTLDSVATVTVLATSQVGALTVGDGALLTLQPRANSPASTAARVLRVTSLDLGSSAGPTGTLDLNDNDLIIDYAATAADPIGTWTGSAYTGVTGYIVAGRNGGTWDGSGIVSSVAAAHTSDYVVVGVMSSGDLGLTGSQTQAFDGQTVDATCVLVKYSYGGDANLQDGITIDDYTQIDSSVSAGGVILGYFNGDFNYDGTVNVDDYTVIDSNIGIQGPPL